MKENPMKTVREMLELRLAETEAALVGLREAVDAGRGYCMEIHTFALAAREGRARHVATCPECAAERALDDALTSSAPLGARVIEEAEERGYTEGRDEAQTEVANALTERDAALAKLAEAEKLRPDAEAWRAQEAEDEAEAEEVDRIMATNAAVRALPLAERQAAILAGWPDIQTDEQHERMQATAATMPVFVKVCQEKIELKKAYERATWELAGCLTYAEGLSLLDPAPPELETLVMRTVRELRLRHDEARAAVKTYLEAKDALSTPAVRYAKEKPVALVLAYAAGEDALRAILTTKPR